MTRWSEQSLIDDSYSTRRDAEVEPRRTRRPYPPETPKCRQCNGKLYGDEIATGLCGQRWCVEWRK